MNTLQIISNLLKDKKALSSSMISLKFRNYSYKYIACAGNHTILNLVSMKKIESESEAFIALFKKLMFIMYEWLEDEEEPDPVDLGYCWCLNEIFQEQYINIKEMDAPSLMQKLLLSINECDNLLYEDIEFMQKTIDKSIKAIRLFDSHLWYQGDVYFVITETEYVLFAVEMCYDRVTMPVIRSMR